MKQLVIFFICIAAMCFPSAATTATTSSDLREMLVGEWVYVESTAALTLYYRFNADGTGAECTQTIFITIDEDPFVWSLAGSTVYLLYKSGKKVRLDVAVSDKNHVKFNGEQFLRRGAKKSEAASTGSSGKTTAKESNSVRNPSLQNSAQSKPIVFERIATAAQLKEFFYHPLRFPKNIKESTGDEFIAYCRDNGFEFFENKVGDTFRYFQIKNPVSYIFNVGFESRINEDTGYKDGNRRMSGDWYSYFSSVQERDAEYDEFIKNVVERGGAYQKTDTLNRRAYLFPNGMKIWVGKWHNNGIQLLIYDEND